MGEESDRSDGEPVWPSGKSVIDGVMHRYQEELMKLVLAGKLPLDLAKAAYRRRKLALMFPTTEVEPWPKDPVSPGAGISPAPGVLFMRPDANEPPVMVDLSSGSPRSINPPAAEPGEVKPFDAGGALVVLVLTAASVAFGYWMAG